MQTNIYESALNKSKSTLLVRTVIGIILLIAAALLFILQEDPFDSTIGRQESIGMMCGMTGLVVLCLGLFGKLSLSKHQKRMQNYGVGAAEITQFEAEYAQWHLSSASGKTSIEITKNWFFCNKPSSTVLLPLKNVIWFHKRVVQDAGNTNSIVVHFDDGGPLFEVFCGVQSVMSNVDTTAEWLNTLVQLCPQALAGYSHRRDELWVKDRKAFIRAVQNGTFED